MFLSRKFDQTKWCDERGVIGEEAQADSLENLRTQGNTLSFWLTGEDGAEEQWRNGALAIYGGFKRLDSFDIIWIPETEFSSNQIELVESEGDTKVVSLRKNHRDATNLSAQKLANIANLVTKSIGKSKFVKRLTKDEVIELIKNAISKKLVSKDNLPRDVQLFL